jgi:FkbM family methyltransferase
MHINIKLSFHYIIRPFLLSKSIMSHLSQSHPHGHPHPHPHDCTRGRDHSQLLEGLTKAIAEYDIVEGGSYQIVHQVARLRELIYQTSPKSIMEIGFNAGHSALLFLAITPPETKVVSFDLGEYAYVFAAKRYIDLVFPGRHTLVTGDSTTTVSKYEEQVAHRMNNPKTAPPLRFDFIFIDGGHQGDIPMKDIMNSKRLAAGAHTVVAIDDISRDQAHQAHYTVEPTKAWNEMISAGVIIEEGYDDYYEMNKNVATMDENCRVRGMAWGYYNISCNSEDKLKNARRLQIQNGYKYMDRMQMVSEIDRLYHQEKNYEKLVALSDMYLEYFADYNKRDMNYIRFYRACGNFIINPKIAIEQYEEIIDSPPPGPNAEADEFPDHIRYYSICNLGILYPKEEVATEIPKIIHILFFGETEFYNFHHRCLHSMLQYMPDYEIWIHNSKEPNNNKYWDDIKTHKNVKIMKTVVPQHFDGFELKHFQYKADVVRLEVLYTYGGVYLDLDMLIVKPFHDVFKSGHSFYISKERKGVDCLINAFLASKPKNEFLRIWLNAFKSGLRLGIWAHHIRDTNKKLLDDHPHYMHKYKIKLLEGDVFMPLHWQDTEAFVRSETEPYHFPPESYGTHLWETILGDVMKRNRFLNKQKQELNIYREVTSLFHLDCITDRLVVSRDYYHDFRNDQFVNEYITKGARNGYFIEIGACDGIESSSCYYFEKNLEWKGMAIEPARVYAESIKKNRQNPLLVAVSNVTSSVYYGMGAGLGVMSASASAVGPGAIFYENDVNMLSGLKVALENNKTGQDWARIGRKEYVVDTITLYDLCCQQNAPEYIDYCAMDCEGSEYDILETFFRENRLSYIKNAASSAMNHAGSEIPNIDLIITNKVYHIDLFSIEVNDNYKEIRELMEANDYEEIENPFLRVITYQGREITWEKYFRNKRRNSPQHSHRTNETSSSSESISTLSSVMNTPHAVNSPPPTSPNMEDYQENVGLVSNMCGGGGGGGGIVGLTPRPSLNAKFLLMPPFADEVVVICIEERPERIKYVSDHLMSYYLKHTLLLNNIHPTNTKVGCFQSHMKAIQYAYNNNLSSVLIVEDDIVIRDNIMELASISLPSENWDILYLGGILTKFDKMDATNKWVKGTIWCNHAYLVKNHMYEPILNFVSSYPNLDELESKNIDYMYTEYIQPKYDCWLANDQYIIQKEGYSEIDGRIKWTNQFDWSTFSMKVV